MPDQTQTAPPSGLGVQAPPETMIDPAQESLGNALRASFNILRVIMAVLLFAYFFSGLFKVDQGEQGLIVRLGQLRINSATGTPVFGAGSHFAWPDPFDEKIRLSGEAQTLTIDTFLFRRDEAQRGKPLSEILPGSRELTPGVDGAMLTGDKALCHGEWSVEYRVVDGDRFVSNIGERIADFEPLLQRLTENAVVRVVAGRRFEDVTREGKVEIAEAVLNKLKADMENLETGVEIRNVISDTIEPGQVRQAFLDKMSAASEAASLKSTANQESVRILNEVAGEAHGELLRLIGEYGDQQLAGADEAQLEAMRDRIDEQLEQAGGQVAVTLRDARARASAVYETIRREHQEFTSYLELYRKAPFLTKFRRWARMRKDVLGGAGGEIFFLPSSSRIIEIRANRNVRAKLEEQMKKYLNPQP